MVIGWVKKLPDGRPPGSIIVSRGYLHWCQFRTSNTIDGPCTPLDHASCNVKRSGSFERNGIILVWEVSAIITKKSLKVKKVGLTNGFLQIYGVYRKSAASNAFAHPQNISPIPILLGNIIRLTFVTFKPLEVEQLIYPFLMMRNSKSVSVFSNIFSLTVVYFRSKGTHVFVLWGAC